MTSTTIIDIWVSDLTFPGYMDWWSEQAIAFQEAHPEYQVAVRGLDFFTGPRQIAEAVAAGRGPAVAEYYFYMGQVARDTRSPDGAPHWTSVERAIDGRTEILGEPVVTDDIVPAVRDYYTMHGDLMSMPSVATTSLLYANTDLLERAGLSRLPRTWNEVEAACAALTDLGGAPSHGITWSNHGMFFQQALATQGGALTDHGNGRTGRAGRIDLQSAEMLAWVNWWRRLHDNGHYLHTGGIPDWQGTFQAFADGRTGLRISSSNDVSYMAEAARGQGFGIAVGPFPYRDGTPFAGNAIAGSSFWLADRLDPATRDGALAFLQFVHSPRNAARRHRISSFLPLTHAAFDLLEAEGWFDRHPYHRAASDALRNRPDGRPELWPPSQGAVFGEFARVQDLMTGAMRDVLGGADPQDRFAEATRSAQSLLDAYNAACSTTSPADPETLRIECFTGAEAYSGTDLENVVRLQR
ncbi:extracellular solute-binding protein [Actinoplanes siamensis]|uniref:ABC transporter substrate-binding protein n=1 Tax=Actinoplanes siamensis TaxID=1223317 RepID=A0A919TM90_9ACTN|nr:extracellular solute-binding protein [Actinoplanes siamensis]GIF07028.1 ABC transporter substrate-binding protein [Actinoplanes siamensis]